jgi:murein DD-endopeptidase MepM/ murein hydrolase activator NlpD
METPNYVLMLWLVALGLGAAGCTTRDLAVCSDYLGTNNCAGGKREIHHGIDFRGRAGTEVISATHGTVVRKTHSECAGHGVIVRTDIVAQHGGTPGQVYAAYVHAEPVGDLQVGQKLKPGEVIARIIPIRRTPCYSSTEHVHYELRVGDSPRRHIDPHQFWADGVGKVTCFRPGKEVPPGKAVAPLRCAR